MTEARFEKDGTFVWPVRIYYEDTDAGTIVYYANYFKFAERARTEFLRHLGVNQIEILDTQKLAFAVRHAEADYLQPARLDDLLEVHTNVTHLGGASLKMEQAIKRDNETIVSVKILIVCMHIEGGAKRIPDDLREIFKNVLISTEE